MSQRITNDKVVEQLKDIVAVMQLEQENRFSIRAYQNAIVSINNLTTSVYDLWQNSQLRDISGVGGGLSAYLKELFEKGSVAEWEKKKKKYPKGMFELLQIRGVGPKIAYKLAKEFKLTDRKDALKKVRKKAELGEIKDMDGFGEKSEKDILDSIRDLKKSKSEKQRVILFQAEKIANRVIKYLEKSDAVIEAVVLGSLRRRASTVGDIDIAISSNKPKEVINHFVKFSEIKDIESKGDKMSTVILGIGIQVDVLVVEPKSFGSMLQHFTGSKAHNIKLRQFALDKKLSLSQYGIKYKGDRGDKGGKGGGGKLKKFEKEEDFYNFLGLDWIPPELREGRGEIKLALEKKLPDLVELSDIKGDLHVHTTASDGINTYEEMVKKARSLGYEYIGFSDHAPSVKSRSRYEVLGIIDSTRRKIEKLNEKYDDITIFYGYEVNILKDKTLGMPDDILEKLDYAIGGIHTSFDVTGELITERLIEAVKNPYIDIIAHPTGRLLNERKAMNADWSKVFDVAKKYNKILEINAQPKRLDLPPHLVYDAINKGIKLIVTTDAHSEEELDFMKYGIDIAKRGWCNKNNIINTLCSDNLKKLFRFDF